MSGDYAPKGRSVPTETETRHSPLILEIADLYEGRSFNIAYPFCRDTFTQFDEEGPCQAKTWRPGVTWEASEWSGGSAFCDREGGCTFTVVSIHKPGRFPTRIFYTRAFTTPDGKRFGKGGLRSCGIDKFRRITRGYFYDYEVVEGDPESGDAETSTAGIGAADEPKHLPEAMRGGKAMRS